MSCLQNMWYDAALGPPCSEVNENQLDDGKLFGTKNA